jgi:hypothetical protein
MNKLALSAMAFALITLSSTSANAQAPQGGPKGPFLKQHEQRLDINGNGRIGWRERQAAKVAVRRQGAQDGSGGPAAGPQGPAREARREAMRKRFDADGDGKLGADERQAAREALHKRLAARREQRIEAMRRIIDRDGDGQVGPQERAAARQRLRVRMQQREALRAKSSAHFFDGGPPRPRVEPPASPPMPRRGAHGGHGGRGARHSGGGRGRGR